LSNVDCQSTLRSPPWRAEDGLSIADCRLKSPNTAPLG